MFYWAKAKSFFCIFAMYLTDGIIPLYNEIHITMFLWHQLFTAIFIYIPYPWFFFFYFLIWNNFRPSHKQKKFSNLYLLKLFLILVTILYTSKIFYFFSAHWSFASISFAFPVIFFSLSLRIYALGIFFHSPHSVSSKVSFLVCCRLVWFGSPSFMLETST